MVFFFLVCVYLCAVCLSVCTTMCVMHIQPPETARPVLPLQAQQHPSCIRASYIRSNI